MRFARASGDFVRRNGEELAREEKATVSSTSSTNIRSKGDRKKEAILDPLLIGYFLFGGFGVLTTVSKVKW